jgi:hypothetical protein
MLGTWDMCFFRYQTMRQYTRDEMNDRNAMFWKNSKAFRGKWNTYHRVK